MSSLDLTSLALGWITAYGSPMVGLTLLIGAMGIPLPSTLLVIVSGAFVRLQYLDIYSTPALALLGAVAGDAAVFAVGWLARPWIQRRFGASTFWLKAQAFFARRGGISIYLTRWMITSLAIPVNLIAGGSGYPVGKFLLFDITGEITWIVVFGSLGYAFGSQWELISDFISNFSGLILGVLVLAAGVYLLLKFRPKASASQAKSEVHTG